MNNCFKNNPSANNLIHDIDLSILVVNYNGRHLLSDCLISICKSISFTYEIIVVDNNSIDGSVNFILENYPGVILIQNKFNAGFTGGNNQAASIAKGRFLLLLNTDTVVNSSIDPVLSLMLSIPDCGVLGCRLIYGDGRLQESIGYEPGPINLALSWLPLFISLKKGRLFYRNVPSNSNIYNRKMVEVEWVSGAFMITPRSLWMKLGGLDEKYFMYMEDVDYCRRVREDGNFIFYSSLTVVTHFEGFGRPWIGKNAVLSTVNSYMIYFLKFHGKFISLLMRFVLIPVFFIRSFGNLIAYIIGKDRYGMEKFKTFFLACIRLIFN